MRLPRSPSAASPRLAGSDEALVWAAMPPNYRQGEPLSRRERRGVALLAALVLLAGTGVGIWEVAKPRPGGSTGRCVSVMVASSTGGAVVTHCGRSASVVVLPRGDPRRRHRRTCPSRLPQGRFPLLTPPRGGGPLAEARCALRAVPPEAGAKVRRRTRGDPGELPALPTPRLWAVPPACLRAGPSTDQRPRHRLAGVLAGGMVLFWRRVHPRGRVRFHRPQPRSGTPTARRPAMGSRWPA